jgi:hypothetical protein
MPNGSKRSPFISERNPPLRVFDIFEGEDVLYLYSDGTARMMLGPEITKIEFVRSVGPIKIGDLDVDQREMFLKLAMPTSSLIEMCAGALEEFGKNATALQAGTASNISILREALKRAAAVKI